MKTDAELLLSYASTRAETDFAGFVGRRIGFVYHAALRQTGGDTQTAEDVTQAVFRLAARRAARLAQHAQLSGWLYTTATHLASRARRDASRRAKREQEAALMSEIENAGSAHDEPDKLRPLLDEALGALRKGERDAVLLRFFEGRGFAEIGAALKLSEDAARMRVARAVEKMHAAFAKRGVTSSASALSALMTAEAAQVAPAGLAASVSAGAMATAVASAATAGAGAILAFMSSEKITTAAIVALLIVAGGAYYGVQNERAASTTLAQARHENNELAAQLRALEKPKEKPKAAASAVAPALHDLTTAALALLRDTPETAEKRAAQNKALGAKGTFRIAHAMNLSPEQSARLAEIAGEIYNHGQQPRKSESSRDEEVRVLLGDEGYEKYKHLERLNNLHRTYGGLPDQGAFVELSAALCFTDEPLTSRQAWSLDEILDDMVKAQVAGTTHFKGWQASWDAFAERAKSVLSPQQMSALVEVGDEFTWQNERVKRDVESRKATTATPQSK